MHRDIKPENLMLRPDGYVKVLDFGVATFARSAPETVETALTIAPMETGVGMVVGTVAYMSPEQARGLAVDGRADCFSLGVVLYELVTGRAPFVGQTTTDLLVAILEKEPPPLRLPARGLPLQLEWIIEKALEKDPALRYQTIADLRVDLMRLKTALDAGRISGSVAPIEGPARPVDEPLERELSNESPLVRSLSTPTWITVAGGVVAATLFVAALAYYEQARSGAELPLQLPDGAVLTKAHDAIESLGHTGWGPRHAIDFESTLDVDDVTALAGLAAAREAVREGVVAQWVVGLSHTRAPGTTRSEPAYGDFAVWLDPCGDTIGFAAGLSTESVVATERGRATALGLDALRKVFGIDATGYELEVIQRAFPAGVVEMTWRNPTLRFGHVEQFRVNLHGERVVRIERSFEKPRGYVEPADTVLTRTIQLSGPVVIGAGFVAAWGFGLYLLFKTRNWDALTNRLPLAVCGTLLQVALSTTDSSGAWHSGWRWRARPSAGCDCTGCSSLSWSGSRRD